MNKVRDHAESIKTSQAGVGLLWDQAESEKTSEADPEQLAVVCTSAMEIAADI